MWILCFREMSNSLNMKDVPKSIRHLFRMKLAGAVSLMNCNYQSDEVPAKYWNILRNLIFGHGTAAGLSLHMQIYVAIYLN